MLEESIMFAFIPQHKSLSEVLMDQKLAKLGDAYVNFLYSMALSKKKGEPAGTKVKGRLLADAFKKAGLRKFLPSRIDRHKQADAAEALIVYSWLLGSMTMEEALEILEQNEDTIEAFSVILLAAKSKTEL
jgi:molybdopterin biosynthesis enzyme